MEQSRTIPVDLLSSFDIPGRIISIEELKRGHINRTYVALWEHAGVRKRYVHQVVNHRIFQDIEGLMKNLDVVTATLGQMKASGRLRSDEVTLTLIKGRSGERFLQDESGEYWRTFEFIEGTVTYDVCPDRAVAAESAAILGRFQKALLELDPGTFAETIPFFLDGGRRFDTFAKVIAEDSQERVAGCSAEIEFAMGRRDFGASLITGLREKVLPCRVTHNDVKLNNVLFNSAGERAICLLDLDTCMAGTVLYDFGDLVRNTAVPCAEDEQDFSKVVFDMDLYRAICEGYLAEAGDFLVPAERDLLALAPRNLALVLGVRFLTDHLQGDTYFRIHRPNQNLERAKTQFQIVRMMERLEGEMRRVAKGY
jgi:Ser/Thr protein kinase RdoA (MazF antagonist)